MVIQRTQTEFASKGEPSGERCTRVFVALYSHASSHGVRSHYRTHSHKPKLSSSRRPFPPNPFPLEQPQIRPATATSHAFARAQFRFRANRARLHGPWAA